VTNQALRPMRVSRARSDGATPSRGRVPYCCDTLPAGGELMAHLTIAFQTVSLSQARYLDSCLPSRRR
jgi:hypothetical protein